MEQEKNGFDCWAIVDLYGHQHIAGRVSEQTIASQGFVRIDVPAVEDQQEYTRLFGPGAIYSITPTSEEIVRAFVAKNVGAPIHPYQLKLQRLPAGPREYDDDESDLEDHFDDGDHDI